MRQQKLQDILISQAQNPRNYPNIPARNFNNLERDIQKVWDATYGIKVVGSKSISTEVIPTSDTSATIRTSVAASGSNTSFNPSEKLVDGLEIHLLVLAVHGTKKDASTKNDTPQARNEIILLNKSWQPLETRDAGGSSGTVEMLLSTRKNNLKVTMDIATGILGGGVFAVKEDLIEEITDLFDGITYQNLSSSPVLKYVYRIKS